ncbi:MAG: PEP/pyruvate-binding domain-containing protein [Pseudonocardiaceae bacterium]
MDTEDAVVMPLDGAQADLAHVGGKGASLARLASAGLPVPPGFHVTTAAYRDFVAHGGLQEKILGLVAEAQPARPDSVEAASTRIGQLFAEQTMPGPTAAAIRTAYHAMGDDVAVAVRSSATPEDLPDMSFAGQQDTFLNISGEPALLDAVRRCWASLWTSRAIGYRDRHGIAPDDVALAVVVQRLVPADAAGILFTTNPLTGARDEVVINAGWGLGEAVVGGQVTPDTYVVDRPSGMLTGRQIGDKAVMTVRTADGTRDEPVPAGRRGEAVLSVEQATGLARLGVRVEELYGRPMDVEWALHDGDFAIVQARPITGLPGSGTAREGSKTGSESSREEWNDSLTGDYLWTCANLGEAIPSVMTPCTWSLVQIFMSEAMSVSSIGPHRICGNIGGRFYLNLSLALSIGSALGVSEFVRRSSEQAFGRIPPDVQVPHLPMPRWQILRATVAAVLPFLRRVLSYQKRLPALLSAVPGRCARLHATIRGTASAGELGTLWRAEVDPLLRDCSRMLAAGARMDGAGLVRIRPTLQKLVGEADTNALLSGLSSGGSLASLGPVLGLGRLARGEIDRETYAGQWGHRCPDEFEVSIPRPAEQPDWIDRQLAGIRQAEHEPAVLLARQERARAAAWDRFQRRHPRRRAATGRRLDRAAAAFRAREAARSEVIRAFWVLRAFVLRAGELTGAGGDLILPEHRRDPGDARRPG